MDREFIELSAYLDGELSDAERCAVEARLASDPAYARELEGLERTRTMLCACMDRPGFHGDLMTRIEDIETVRRRIPRSRAAGALAAAALLLAVAVLVYTLKGNRDQGPASPGQAPERAAAVGSTGDDGSGDAAPVAVASGEEPAGERSPAARALAAVAELPLELAGTVTGPQPSAVIAVYEDGSGDMGTYGVGDEVIEGVTLVEVRAGEAVLDHAGALVILRQGENYPGRPAPNLTGAWLVSVFRDGVPDDEVIRATVIHEGSALRVVLEDSTRLQGQLTGRRAQLWLDAGEQGSLGLEGEFNDAWTRAELVVAAWTELAEATFGRPRPVFVIEREVPGSPGSERAREQAVRQCRAEFETICGALRRFARDEEGRLPGELAQLVPDYMPNADALKSDERKEVQYHPGLRLGDVPDPRPWPEAELDSTDHGLTFPDRLMRWEHDRQAAGYGDLLWPKPVLRVHYVVPEVEFVLDVADRVPMGPCLEATSLSGTSPGEVARRSAVIASCQNNLKVLGIIIRMFENENRGYTPPGWLATYPEYLTDPRVLTSTKDPLGTDSYQYLMPATNVDELIGQSAGRELTPQEQAESRSVLPLVVNGTPYPGPNPGRNVLFADGHVEYVPTGSARWRNDVQPYLR